jgi:tryptophan synthase alpha chain
MTVTEAFQADASEGRLTLAGYLPAGYPDEKQFVAAVGELSSAGFRVLEIGIPPLRKGMDGPIIEGAVSLVEERGMDAYAAVALGGVAAARHGLAAVGMLYSASLQEVGLSTCLGLFQENGIHAILVPDMPVSNWKEFAQVSCSRGIEPVGFVTPEANEALVRSVARHARGFLYVPSYAGRTGESFDAAGTLRKRLPRIISVAREHALSVAVGFGLRRKQDIEAVKHMGAQGAVVGTALVEAAGKGQQALHEFLLGLGGGQKARSCRQ